MKLLITVIAAIAATSVVAPAQAIKLAKPVIGDHQIKHTQDDAQSQTRILKSMPASVSTPAMTISDFNNILQK